MFATSNGISLCDAVGGTEEQQAARASLQHTDTKRVNEFVQENIYRIKYFYLSQVTHHWNWTEEMFQ